MSERIYLKPNKAYIFVGFAILVLGGVLGIFNILRLEYEDGIFCIMVGLVGLCLAWIMDLQISLYGRNV